MSNRKGAGRRRWLSEEQRKELAEMVETGPDAKEDGVIRWRRIDLVGVIENRFGVRYSERAISALPDVLGLSYISGRPQHPLQNEPVIEAFKKNVPRRLQAHIGHLPKGKRIEIWFQGEARLGQKNGRARIWARRGTRPRVPADQRYAKAHLFDAMCSARGTRAGLMMPFANIRAMQLHLEEIRRTVAPKAHAVILMDRASWHTTEDL
ncbi:MAG: IS630 family transposase [Rhodospirillum sp.]|nr:IS630 family transposase [Rhodospirillum sp.]MCF8500780.1 IS630 family transposase [Rhodospirillum sp.]